MAELRLNPATRRWIVTGKRPVAADHADDPDVSCPFCPGHEHLTPKAITEASGPGGAWSVRVFHDRAPLLRIEGPLEARAEGMYDRMNPIGAHEIVVETPRHGVTFPRLPVEQLAKVTEVCRDRILDLKCDRRFRYVSLFKDQAPLGESVKGHSHSQILASPVMPQLVQNELRWSRFHFQRKERCLYCDIIRQETRQDRRVVDQSADFIALCPFASSTPYETWILPTRHASSFERDLDTPGRVRSFAAFLKDTVARIEKISPQWHVVVHTEPNRQAHAWPQDWWQTLAEDFHWHIEIHPDVEGQRRYLGSQGFYFNPIPAEEATLVLKALGPEIEPEGGAGRA
jgi:UDPglucose--hexose-1-phosphate uridylyltransferase